MASEDEENHAGKEPPSEGGNNKSNPSGEAAELWDRGRSMMGRKMLEARGDPFIWLTGCLYLELGTIPEDQLLSPEKSSDDSEGIPQGTASLYMRRLYTLRRRYECAGAMSRAQAGLCVDQEARRRHEALAERNKSLARVVEVILDFCLREICEVSKSQRIFLASDWMVRVTRIDGDEAAEED